MFADIFLRRCVLRWVRQLCVRSTTFRSWDWSASERESGYTSTQRMGAVPSSALSFNTISKASRYCIVSMHLYSASYSAQQSEAFPVRETQREESSLERTKRGTWPTS